MTGRAAPPGSRLALDFIGQSSVFIELDGVCLLTDPVTGAFVECAAELAPHVQTVPTAVGDVVGWEA